MTRYQTFPIGTILLGTRCQMREQSSPEVIDDYANTYRTTPDVMPPPHVYIVAGSPQCTDGYHRVTAALMAGVEFLRCAVVGEGTADDAEWAACAANQGHGLRRSNADKRRSVERALGSPIGSEMTATAIAEHVGVSVPFVAAMRRERETSATEDVLTVNTSPVSRRKDSLGRLQPASKPPLKAPEPTPKTPAWTPPVAKVRPEPELEALPDCRTWLDAADVLRAARLECVRILPSERSNRIEHALKAEESLLRASVPVQCIDCGGGGCKTCGGRGWLSTSHAKDLKRHA